MVEARFTAGDNNVEDCLYKVDKQMKHVIFSLKVLGRLKWYLSIVIGSINNITLTLIYGF